MQSNLFPGFEDRWVDTSGGRLHAQVGGATEGEPLLLLHGFPQSCLSWHSVAPELSETYRVVCLDLKGYGQSAAPRGDNGQQAYTKRQMAREALEVMQAEGYSAFSVAGHDRGAQVAYRLALDHPQAVRRLGILDNLPILSIWDLMKSDPAALPHWRSLARPGHEAEAEITDAFLVDLLRVHTGDGTLRGFEAEALAAYRGDWASAAHRHAYAEDYRAGATTDLEHDLLSRQAGAVVQCPTLILWGEIFLGQLAESPARTWRNTFAPEATALELTCGHFLLEEKPHQTLAALQFLMSL